LFIQSVLKAVPWLVADGYVAAHHKVLNALPLILVTSNWVKETYIRDGIRGDNIEVLPVGCDTDGFAPRSRDDPKVRSIREALGVADDETMILTVGGDATSKGAQEVMQALALIRPGAAALGMKETFIRRARGLEPPPPLAPRLDGVAAAGANLDGAVAHQGACNAVLIVLVEAAAVVFAQHVERHLADIFIVLDEQHGAAAG
jgi:hypothetical protein